MIKSTARWTIAGMVLNGISAIISVIVCISCIYMLKTGVDASSYMYNNALTMNPEFPGADVAVLGQLFGSGIMFGLTVVMIILIIVLAVNALLSVVPLIMGFVWLKEEKDGNLSNNLNRGNAIARMVFSGLGLLGSLLFIPDIETAADLLGLIPTIFYAFVCLTNWQCIKLANQHAEQTS